MTTYIDRDVCMALRAALAALAAKFAAMPLQTPFDPFAADVAAAKRSARALRAALETLGGFSKFAEADFDKVIDRAIFGD
jgi:phage I-like protein